MTKYRIPFLLIALVIAILFFVCKGYRSFTKTEYEKMAQGLTDTTREIKATISIGRDGGGSMRMTTSDGKPVDSNTVLLPEPGIRNYYFYTGSEWIESETAEGYVMIFEFIGTKGERFYQVERGSISRSEMGHLWKYVWDDKMFNCGGTTNEGDNDELDAFDVNMDNNGLLHGGNLKTLKIAIEKYFNKSNSL